MKVLVTGATGFLGGAMVQRLLAMGAEVTGMGRNTSAGAKLERAGARFLRAELADATAVMEACRGQDFVFHCGALSSPWGSDKAYYLSNVVGTENVVSGCRHHGVGRLIHVSSPGIYFDYRDRFDVRESEPLPKVQKNGYTQTKLWAEGVVDHAHRAGLPVVTLRPRAIIGPGDLTILPRVLRAMEAGRLKRVGDGKNLSDFSHIENVVDAMVLCMDSGGHTLGKKYNITNGDTVLLWELMEAFCSWMGYTLPDRKIPFAVAWAVAYGMESFARYLGGGDEPVLTCYGVALLAKSMTLNIDAAREELGYQPRVTTWESARAFTAWWQSLQAEPIEPV